jgi:hypothetical protein
VLVAGTVMGAVMWFLPQVSLVGGIVDEVGHVAVPAAVGGLVYVLALKLLRVSELDHVLRILQRRGR